MTHKEWSSEMPPDWVSKEIQLRLFPMTEYEILLARVNEMDREFKAKQDRQRKAQFGKIGSVEKRMNELEDRLAIIERGLCQTAHECEILEMVGR